MPALEMIELYPSPWSERLRWALEWKRVPYARRPYQPLADEEDLRQRTGHTTVPVLLADGDVVGDSDAALEWLEAHHPAPALVPADACERAQVRAWEIAATESMAPFGRLIMIGRYKALDLQPLADHFAAKYGWTPAAETRAERLLRLVLRDLAQAVERSPYLVGSAFTRADLTVAAMLGPIIGLPSDDLFALDAGMRAMFGVPFAGDADLAPLGVWRDAVYRKHRGGRVTPAAAA
jgi:glutathione S-transferase